MTNRHVLLLAGGLSHEREVSLRSGSRLAQALRSAGHEVTVRDADGSLLDWIETNRPDAAVITLHGGRGENGSVQSVLDMVAVPFVGTDAAGCRLAWDKATAKVLLSRAGFTTPRWLTVSHHSFRDLGADRLVAAIGASIGFPLMLKPYQGGSALGARVVRAVDDLPSALVGSFAYGDVVLVEEFVAGTEVAVSVIDSADGPQALPAVEIVPPGDLFDYEARYTAGTTTYHCPARLDEQTGQRVADLALAAHRILGLRDVSRTDAIVDADGAVHFLEVNVSPGLTETSMLPMSVAAAGQELASVYSGLVEQAITRVTSKVTA